MHTIPSHYTNELNEIMLTTTNELADLFAIANKLVKKNLISTHSTKNGLLSKDYDIVYIDASRRY